jgi:Ni/Co efflux regulator RcnB
MAKLLVSTALAGLLLSGAALAQPPDDHRGHGPAAAAHGGPPPAPRAAPAAPRAAPAAPQAARGAPPNHRQAVDHRPSAGQQAAPRAQQAPRAAMRGAPAGNAMAMHGPAMAGPTHNFASVQRNFNSPHRFHASTYQRPRGWYARRWTFGETLPALFWTQNYWIGDYVDYGLMPPPPGTIWVRDGSDALLIDQGDGEIIEVAYSVFY